MMTIIRLTRLKKKIDNNKHFIKVLYCYLKDNINIHAFIEKHLIIPFFTDKSCSGKINNSLWVRINNTLNFLFNNNISYKVIGVSKRFKKKYFVEDYMHHNAVIGNVYNLSSEAINLLICFILFREFFLNTFDNFFLLFNNFIDTYKQDVSYYHMRSLERYMLSFKSYRDMLSIINLYTFISLYCFLAAVVIFDACESTMYSEYGSRAYSMSNSITQVKENVELFRKTYNNLRQGSITNSLIEMLSYFLI